MKNLIEIAKIVTKKRVRKIEIFDDHSLRHKNSKFNDFYEALVAMKFKNDRDASRFLYDCPPTDDKYRQLKSRFRKRLLNTLFFLDVNLPSTSSYDRAYYSCNKDWTLVKILLSNDATFTANSLARQILTIALKYKFSDVIVNCSRILRKFAADNKEEKDFEEYDAYIKQFSNVLDAEIRSEELFQRVIMNYYKPADSESDLTEKIDIYCDALVGLSEVYDSPVIVYNMYLVWTFRYEMLHDFESMLEVCGQGEKYIETHPDYYQEDKLATFQLKKMSAYLHLRDFKNGKINAEKCLQTFPDGSETWFDFMEYYLLLTLHTDNFVNAIAIFNRAKGNSGFRKLDTETKDRWNIYDAYLNYILESLGEENPVLKSQRKKSFRLSKFLADPILFPKEQRVFTIHLVIAQFLFLIDKKNYTQATERVERLRNYANRQLKKEENYRLIQFIRLLQGVAKAEYQRSDLTGTEKYYDRLVETPFYYRGLTNEFEVIPFEKLWNLVLSRLK